MGLATGHQRWWQSFKKTFDSIHYIYDALPGLNVGRHHGFRAAKGDILVFLDDDIEAFPTLLSSIEEAFEEPQGSSGRWKVSA